MERSATIPWRKTLQMLSSCQGTSGCYKTSQSSRCLTASEAWRPPLCSRSVSDLEISGNLLGRLLSWSLKGVSCLCAPSKAIHMETDPQTISAYLIYLSQHAPVEEQASHNDLALVINASCFNYISNTCFFFSSQFCSHATVLTWILPAIGCCPANRGALHHHEQPVLQTLLQARVWRCAQCFPHHLLGIHQENEEDQRGRGSLQLGEGLE